jgi:hypothetical protein
MSSWKSILRAGELYGKKRKRKRKAGQKIEARRQPRTSPRKAQKYVRTGMHRLRCAVPWKGMGNETASI